MNGRPRALAILAATLSLIFAPAPLPAAARTAPYGAAAFWTPARVREALARPRSARDGTRAGATAIASRAPDSVAVPEPASPADRTNGSLLGYDPLGGPYSCSGTSLATPDGSIVLTAGHCLYEGGRWSQDLVFIPALDQGRRPFGTFTGVAGYAMPRWLGAENSDYDVGALRVAPLAGRTLAATVGARPWTSGRSRTVPFTILGYPAGGIGGEELRSCATVGLGADPHATVPGTPTVPATCAMGNGASGGAWLLGGKIDGVTSYGYPAQPQRLYSPYFGTAVASFLSSLP